MIKSDVISEDDDGPEAKGAHGRQIDDLDEASRATAGAAPAEGGQTRPQSASTRTFCIAKGGSKRKLKCIRCLQVQNVRETLTRNRFLRRQFSKTQKCRPYCYQNTILKRA